MRPINPNMPKPGIRTSTPGKQDMPPPPGMPAGAFPPKVTAPRAPVQQPRAMPAMPPRAPAMPPQGMPMPPRGQQANMPPQGMPAMPPRAMPPRGMPTMPPQGMPAGTQGLGQAMGSMPQGSPAKLGQLGAAMGKTMGGMGMKKGGKVSSASSRADGCATKGKTKGRFV